MSRYDDWLATEPNDDNLYTCDECGTPDIDVSALAWVPDPKTYKLVKPGEDEEYEWDADVRAKCPICSHVIHRSLMWHGIPYPVFD